MSKEKGKEKERESKTNAMRLFEGAGFNYKYHTYDTEDGKLDGVSVAKKCGQDPNRVFKTLVTTGKSGDHYVFVIPVGESLDLKKAAAAVKEKYIEMLPQRDLLPLTGYVHGGCSPFGMKKQFFTVFEETAYLFDTIMVSAGKIGYQLEASPADMQSLLGEDKVLFADLIV